MACQTTAQNDAALPNSTEESSGTKSSKPGVPKASLPSLELRDTTPDLLLTWVADDGDFHVAESIAAVPEARRAVVRVVRTAKIAGTGSTVYVANLNTSAADGTYPVSTMARSDWEALGADSRKSRMEAFSPKARPKPTAPADSSASGGQVSAIIYGADWCKPCHQAEAYLKTLNVQVTKKNIEKSRAAAAEMREKLARIQRRSAGIPVIDIMGSLFIGFSKASLKQAVDAARSQASDNSIRQ